jgi:cell division control protein 6
MNDLACLLDATKRYKRGVSLDELMGRIEDKLMDQRGYFLLFVDEVDHVRRDADSFMKFLVRRLPQAVRLKVMLIFSSNRLNWQDNLDPRIKSFLKINEILFDPYDAFALQRILSIRIKKALNASMISKGVVEKIAAISSRSHGDARKAVELLSKSAELAEKARSRITSELVDQAVDEIEKDKYVAMAKSAPRQLQAALCSALLNLPSPRKNIGEYYDAYQRFCSAVGMRALTHRAFSDLISELDIYGFVQVQMVAKGRQGRMREVIEILPPEIAERLKSLLLTEFGLTRPENVSSFDMPLSQFGKGQ